MAQQTFEELLRAWGLSNYDGRYGKWLISYHNYKGFDVFELLQVYKKIKKNANLDFKNLDAQSVPLLFEKRIYWSWKAWRLQKRILQDAVTVLTGLKKPPIQSWEELTTRNIYNLIAHFLGDEDVYWDLRPEQAKRLLSTIEIWQEWVNMTLPFKERFEWVMLQENKK